MPLGVRVGGGVWVCGELACKACVRAVLWGGAEEEAVTAVKLVVLVGVVEGGGCVDGMALAEPDCCGGGVSDASCLSPGLILDGADEDGWDDGVGVEDCGGAAVEGATADVEEDDGAADDSDAVVFGVVLGIADGEPWGSWEAWT